MTAKNKPKNKSKEYNQKLTEFIKKAAAKSNPNVPANS